MPHKIGAYLRVSTEEQAIAIEGSLDNQRYHLQSFVDLKNRQEKGWGKIAEFYVDDGYSAKDTRRPAYQRMMADLKKGNINLILIADLSRLSRNIHDFSTLLNELDRLKAKFLSIKEQFDTSTPAGKMMIFNLINLAQFEREQVSERVSLGVHARAMRGLLNGGRPILGYDKNPEKPGTYVLNRGEADQVRTIFKLFLKSGSRAKTVQQLDLLGIKPKSPTGSGARSKWSSQSLGLLLNSVAYLGIHEVNRRNKNEDQTLLKPSARYQRVKATWPAIISQETFDEAQTLLCEAKQLERTRLKDAEKRAYILTGLLRCGTCGGALVGATSHGSQSVHRYYGHTVTGAKHGCAIQRVAADAIEEAVISHLREGSRQAGYFKHLEEKLGAFEKTAYQDQTKESRQLKERLADLETQAINIFQMQGQRSMSADATKLLSESIERIAKEKRELSERLQGMSEHGKRGNSTGEAIQAIKARLGEFERGFAKATPMQKKRLLRRTVQQLVLANRGISVFFHQAEEDGASAHKMHLVLDDLAQGAKVPTYFLTRTDREAFPKLSVLSSSIRKFGDSSWIRTSGPLLRRQMLYPTELWSHDNPLDEEYKGFYAKSFR